MPINQQYRRFIAIISPLVERYVPLCRNYCEKNVPWAVNAPRALQRDKNEAWRHFKSCRSISGRNHVDTTDAYVRFTEINRQIKMFAVNSQVMYEKHVASQIKDNPKLFHSYIKHRRVQKPSVGPLRLPCGNITDDPLSMADYFASTFASIYNNSLIQNPCPNQLCNSTISDVVITPAKVEQLLLKLDCGSAMGEDGLHPRMLKTLACKFSVPLTIIFKSSLEQGYLPDQWLSSIVVPIFKKSSRYDPINYRPISLTSTVCKTLERIIVKHLFTYFDINDILTKKQFGFRKSSSTIDQLIHTNDDLTYFIDRGLIVDIVFFDFEKAFDKVNHVILIRKLSDLGVDGQVLSWIRAFLSDRRMRVRVAGVRSHQELVTSGVPQGSVLGPVLFLVYVNNVISNLSSRCKMFADDIKLYVYCIASDYNDAYVERTQKDINTLVHTSQSWGLKLNDSKCVVMRFSPRNCDLPYTGESPYKIDNVFLKFVECHKDLGITIDRSLKFHVHIRKVAAVAGGMLTNLLSSTLCRDASFLMSIYRSHIRPQLEYGSTLWNTGYIGDMRMLERVQRRLTRAVHGINDMTYRERLLHLDLFSF